MKKICFCIENKIVDNLNFTFKEGTRYYYEKNIDMSYDIYLYNNGISTSVSNYYFKSYFLDIDDYRDIQISKII